MQSNLFQSLNIDKFIGFNKEQLILFFEEQKKYTDLVEKERDELKNSYKNLQDKIVLIEEQLVLLRRKLFRKKSEKITPDKKNNIDNKENDSKGKKKRRSISLLPSEKYPEAAIIEEHVEFKDLPFCSCCQAQMSDSGMTENSEFITTEPKDFYIVKQVRHKYRCLKCHGDIKVPPAPKRIIPGSVYSDDMITDVALSKYCDLVPVERYATIAGREGLEELPPNSLIGTTHKLADFVEPAAIMIKEEALAASTLNADETPHKMFEQEEKKTWYLWSFSTPASCYFEIKNTRSADVASDFLNKSHCEYLVSDVYSGYAKAVRETNKIRSLLGSKSIINVYCNAHSRRKFVEAAESYPEEAEFYINCYKDIYKLEREGQEDPFYEFIKKRKEMRSIFESMKTMAESQKESYSSKSSLVMAMNYFLKNYEGLTIFLGNCNLPIDNNRAERTLRNPVIGRKTWFGTHSKQGARTAAIMFTLVESCKLNKLNPREYLKKLTANLHQGKKAFTPSQYKFGLIDTS
jgi:transposase